MTGQTFGRRLRGNLWFVTTRITAYEAAIIAITLLFCWWRGYTTRSEIADMLVNIGVLVFCFGVFSTIGGWWNAHSMEYGTGQPYSASLVENVQGDDTIMWRNMRTILLSILLSLLTLIIAEIMQTVSTAL